MARTVASKPRRNQQLIVKISKEEKAALRHTADTQDVPASCLVRKWIKQGIRETDAVHGKPAA